MAAKKAKAKGKAKAKAARKSATKQKSSTSGISGLKLGNYSLDSLLKSSGENLDAVVAANRTIINGYTDIARHQYEMLKNLMRELSKVHGSRDVVVKELKGLVERAKRDMLALQKEAKRTNSKAQNIVKKRADANLKAFKKLAAELKKSVGGKRPAAKQTVARKKATPRKRPVAKKKAASRKRAAAR